MKRLGALIAVGLIGMTAGGAAAAEECRAAFDGDVTISVTADRLVTSVGGKPVAEEVLPLVGSGWACEAMHAFPDHALLFMKWHEGSAGTYLFYTQVDLLAFTIHPTGARPAGRWVLRQTIDNAEGTTHKTRRGYSLSPGPDGVTVTLTGVERALVEGR